MAKCFICKQVMGSVYEHVEHECSYARRDNMKCAKCGKTHVEPLKTQWKGKT